MKLSSQRKCMKKNRPLIIYLDSSDYSVLSGQISKEHTRCLNELAGLSEKGKVIFVFSCSIVSEMLPISKENLSSASIRLKLMNSLCKYSLPALSDLMQREVTGALNSKKAPVSLLTPKYGWIPTLANKSKPTVKFKFPSSTDKIKFYSEAKRISLENGCPKVISEFALAISIGAISQENASVAAIYESRNIDFLLNLIEFRFEFSSILSKAIRDPSVKFYESMQKSILDLEAIKPTKIDWNEQLNKNWVSIINRVANSINRSEQFSLTLEQVREYCPGLTTAVLSSYSSMLDSFREKNPRNPKNSDFADSLHALYAPYVDIFRADKYMSPHIRNGCPNKNVHIASDLLELPEIIKDLLSKA